MCSGLVLLSVYLSVLGVVIEAASGQTADVHLDNRPNCPCGSNIQSLKTRIVGGEDAAEGQFPYATGLLFNYPGLETSDYNPRQPFCGGTLITDRHVLTAAHCIKDKTVEEISLDVGDYDLHSKTKIYRNTSSMLGHPKYVSETFDNDIALIEMDEPIDWSKGVKAAWLAPSTMKLDPGTKVTVYGWGRLQYTGGRPYILQSIELPVIDSIECQRSFRKTITENMICAGGEEGHDACIGDSGSGLTVRLDNNYAIVGVVSFGKRCALEGVAGVYTKVPNFVNWIYEGTRNANCKPCIAEKKK